MAGDMTIKFPAWWLHSKSKSSLKSSAETKNNLSTKTKTGTWIFKLRSSTSMNELLKQ